MPSAHKIMHQWRQAGDRHIRVAFAVIDRIERRRRCPALPVAKNDEMPRRHPRIGGHIGMLRLIPRRIEELRGPPTRLCPLAEEILQRRASRLATLRCVEIQFEIRAGVGQIMVEQIHHPIHRRHLPQQQRIAGDDVAQIDQRMRRAQRRQTVLQEMQQRIVALRQPVTQLRAVIRRVEKQRQHRTLRGRQSEILRGGVHIRARCPEGCAKPLLRDKARAQQAMRPKQRLHHARPLLFRQGHTPFGRFQDRA